MINNLTIIDALFVSAIFALICTLQAAYQAKKFASNKPIDHLRHGIYYGLVCTFISIWFIYAYGWVIGLRIWGAAILVRAAFFDPILNLMRHNPIWYNGSYTKTTWQKSSSWLDWFEHKIIHDLGADSKMAIIYLKISYILLWLLYIIII